MYIRQETEVIFVNRNWRLLLEKSSLRLCPIAGDKSNEYIEDGATTIFHSLGSLIESAERQLASNSNDASEYMVRRLDEYERTVSNLLARLNETYENLPNILRSFERFYVSD